MNVVDDITGLQKRERERERERERGGERGERERGERERGPPNVGSV